MKKDKTEFFSFNINDTILVKIQDKGYQHMANNHNKYIKYHSVLEYRTAEYYKNKADENGYTAMQAWCFIEEFGPVTGWGSHGFFSTEILIESKDLKPVIKN